MAELIRFGPFEVSPDSGELRKNGTRLKLTGQAIQVLITLVERPEQVVTREELQEKLWPGASFGDFDHGLNAAVKRLRDVLGDSAIQPKYIETLPRKGYRFIRQTQQVPQSTGGSVPVHPFDKRKMMFAILGVCLLVVGISIPGGHIDQATTSNPTNVDRPRDRGSDSTPVSHNPQGRSVGLGYFAGTWKNTEPQTRGITTVRIRTQGSLVWVHAWGKCRPRDCDWGEVPAMAFGPDVSADVPSNARNIEALFMLGFCDVSMTLRPSGVDLLEAEQKVRFSDNSGRSNASLTETFRR